jgi:hypothetical protein
LLAPDIIEAILKGRQRRGIALQELMHALPGAWTEQRNLIGKITRIGQHTAYGCTILVCPEPGKVSHRHMDPESVRYFRLGPASEA